MEFMQHRSMGWMTSLQSLRSWISLYLKFVHLMKPVDSPVLSLVADSREQSTVGEWKDMSSKTASQ